MNKLITKTILYLTIFSILIVAIVSQVTASLSANAINVPNDFINLKYWYLTLPTPITNPVTHGTPDNIYDLTTYTNPSWFHLNATKTGIVFSAPTGGATTVNSPYPRSELREMFNPSMPYERTCTTGPKNGACWSTSDKRYHAMYYEAAATHLPIKKPSIAIGQIHDPDTDIVEIKLTGSNLVIDARPTDNSSLVHITLTNAYKLGDRFSIKFETLNTQTNIYYNGALKYSINRSFGGSYFKLGGYTQATCDPTLSQFVSGTTCSEYGESVVYALKVCHAIDKASCTNI